MSIRHEIEWELDKLVKKELDGFYAFASNQEARTRNRIYGKFAEWVVNEFRVHEGQTDE